MKCLKCNCINSENAKFCIDCGEKLLPQFLACANESCVDFGKLTLPLDAKFCPKCGNSIEMESSTANLPIATDCNAECINDIKIPLEKQLALAKKYGLESDFSEGLAIIHGRCHYCGVIDGEGKLVIPCDHYFINEFHEGLASVAHGTKWGFIDNKGREVIPFIYDDAGCFHEGLAIVKYNGKYGFINSTGGEIIPCKYKFASDFNEGLAIIQDKGKYGFIDKNNQIVIPCIYNFVGEFHEGLAYAVIATGPAYWPTKRAGYINKKGEVVIPFVYHVERFATNFKESLWINRPPMVEALKGLARNFQEGLAKVMIGKKYGFINKKGDVIIPCEYDYARDFNEGLALVRSKEIYGFIDKNNQIVFSCSGLGFEFIDKFKKGLARIMKKGKFGLIDKTGKIIKPCVYDDIYVVLDLIKAKVGYSEYFFDLEGNLLDDGNSDDENPDD